jgi:acyl carrier protein
MNEHEVRGRIIDILHQIAPEANMGSLDPNENLREALDIDSFDFLKVLVALSERFSVDIPEADYRRVSTLNGMIDYLNTHMPSQTR